MYSGKDKQTNSDVTRNVVKQYFDRIQSGAEPEAIAALFSEDVDWDIPGNVDLVPYTYKLYSSLPGSQSNGDKST